VAYIEFIVMSALAILLLSIRALDVASTLLAVIYGTVIWHFHGFSWFFVLFIFLVISVYATKIGEGKQKSEHEHRSTDNVMSNGLVAFMSAVFGYPYFFLGSISAALSDTLGSEIGMLSKEKPYLITNPKVRVDAGTDGGVSKLGLFSSLLGASVIAIAAYFLNINFISLGDSKFILFFAVALGGFSGSIVDSFIGALFERKGNLTNGSVNFIATMVGGIVTSAIMAFL